MSHLSLLCDETRNNIQLEDIISCDNTLTQFIIDPSSFNLEKRVHIDDPCLPKFLKVCRNYCYLVDKHRMKIINQ